MLTGGRVTAEDAYAYSKFARVALGTNDIDFRARPLSAEEAVVPRRRGRAAGPARRVTYADLEAAPTVVLAGLEPEDEAGTIFLRLRKAARGTAAPASSRSRRTPRAACARWAATLVPTAPGDEAAALDGARSTHGELGSTATAVILVGERLATVARRARPPPPAWPRTTGARLAWVPRRAGDRGALETGCLPNLLPGGRPVADAAARVDVATAWGVDDLPETAGRDADAIVAALGAGELGGLVVGGVDPDDTADPAAVRAALDAASFVVALELRETDVTRAADVVFPVAPVTDKAGTFVTWEGRPRPFDAVLRATRARCPTCGSWPASPRSSARPLGFRTVAEARAEMEELGPWDGERAALDGPRGHAAPAAAAGEARARHLEAAARQRLDAGRRRRPARHRPRRRSPGVSAGGVRRPSGRRRHRSPVTAARSTLPAEVGRPAPTTSCGCRPTPPAAACSPTWPRPAAAVDREGSDP